MHNVNVTSDVTEILPAALRAGKRVLLQNQSDTAMKIAIGEDIAQLSASLGLALAADETFEITGRAASKRVAAIHGGTGSKVLHCQIS